MAQTFTDGQLQELSDDYAFYRQVDSEGQIKPGQFVAVSNYAEPEKTANGFVFLAMVGILDQPNSQVTEQKLSAAELNAFIKVPGGNAAKTVSKTHGNLIRALLA